MSYASIAFLIALAPALVLYRSLHNVIKCLTIAKRKDAVREAVIEAPLMICAMPILLTIAMLLARELDANMIQSSFVDQHAATSFQLFLFSLDQVLRGSFFDVMEVLKISLSSLEHTCRQPLFCVSLIFARFAAGTAMSAFLLAATIWISGIVPRSV